MSQCGIMGLNACGPADAQALRPLTLRESLANRKYQLESQLTDVNEALAALEANPDIETVLNLVQKANY